jgi:hypothetical protein
VSLRSHPRATPDLSGPPASKIGNTWHEQDQYQEAGQACEVAETALGPEPVEPAPESLREWMRVQFDRMWVHYWLAQWPEISDIVERARSVVEHYGIAAHRANLMRKLGMRTQTDLISYALRRGILPME